MKIFKIILLLAFLLGFSIEASAQMSLEGNMEMLKCDTLKRNMVKTVYLNHTDFLDTLSVQRSNYLFRVRETLYVSFKSDYSTLGVATEPIIQEKLECHLRIADESLLTNQVYYQNSKSIDPDSLWSVSFADTILLTPGTYQLTSTIIRKRYDVDSGTLAAKALRTKTSTIEPINSYELTRPVPRPIKPVPPIDPLPPLPMDTIKPFPLQYVMTLLIETKGVAPEEQPMPDIPWPAINLGDNQLTDRFGKNAVSTFKSRTGNKEEGMIVVNYYDGLGRSEEVVQQGKTPSRKDLVTLQEYDEWGRKSNTWLPVMTPQNTGDFISTDSCERLAHNTYGEDTYPYVSFTYENSPLEKVIRQNNPGRAWNEHKRSLRIDEYVNIAYNDTLDCFSLQLTNGVRETINVTVSREYKSGSLLITRSEDEDGIALFEFKDRLGRTVLQRRIESRLKGSKQLSDTYYIYDNWGKLCAVLPPALSDRLSVGTVSTKDLDMYAYLYKYDVAGNLMAKKLPGISWEYYVYNTEGYLLFSQNGEERKRGEWKFSIPDVLGRVCLQGICRKTIDAFDNPYLKKRLITLPDNLLKTLPDTYCEYVGGGEYGGYQLGKELFGPLMGTEPLFQAINYYDNYDFMYQKELLPRKELMYVSEKGFAGTSSSAKGMLTGTSRLLSDSYDRYCNGETDIDSPFNHSVMYYDDRGRLSQSVSENHLGGMDRDFFSYDFNGNPLRHLHRHTKEDNDTLSSCYTYQYDHADRLTQVTHQLGDTQEVVLTDNTYDDLGRLSGKTFHNNLLNTSYTYNIRSWLTGITSPSFEQKLYYTDGPGAPYYNGNISSMIWRSGSEDVTRGYRFTYDGLSRLTDSKYGEGSSLAQNLNRFNEQVIEYDKMGNIRGLLRYGQTSPTDYGLVDNLNLIYNGNQLQSVYDNVKDSVGGNGMEFKNGADEEFEYEYDRNGNLTKDLNKKIWNIQYNYLNLPCRIEFENGDVVSYLYNADGAKLRTTHIIQNDTTVTDYLGNVIYENGTPVKLLTEVGYVTLNDQKYHYFIQDHQGNNRVVVDQSGNVEEVNHYYPFGGLMSSSGSNAVQHYKYNGKELDRKGGLDWYDYRARMYDATLGRWHAVDPLSEKYYGITPYAYCANNPIRFIDPNGMEIENPPGFWASFGKGFSQPFISFWNTLSHPVETATSVVNSIKSATPVEVGLGIGEQMLRSSMNPLAGTLNQLDVVQAIAYDKANGTMTSAEVVGSQWGEVAFDAGTIAVGAGVGKVAGTLGETSSGVGKVKGLGNPFKKMTLDQVRTSMDKHVSTGRMKVVVIDRETGLNKTYYNNKSGYSYNLDEGGPTRIGRKKITEPPHIDINYPKPKPRNIEKKKLPVNN